MGLNEFLDPKIIALTLFLVGVGAVLKHRTPVDNNLIAVVLFLLAFVLSTVLEYVGPGQASLVSSLLWGLIKGGGAASVAVFGWDSIHGLVKFGIKKREAKV